MLTYEDYCVAVLNIVDTPLRQAGLSLKDYDVDQIAAKVIKKNRYGRFERAVSSVQFWQIVESAVKY